MISSILKGFTYKGERFVGIAPDRTTAQQVIADYMQRNQNNAHHLTYKKITTTTIIAASTTNVYQDFLRHCPKGYQLFSMVNYNTLSIAKNDTLEAAIWYYLKIKNTTPKIAKNKVHELIKKYDRYLSVY